MGVTFSWKNKKATTARLVGLSDKITATITQEALKDMDDLVPADSLQMRDSAYMASDFDKGELVWDEPYAKEQYYGTTYDHSGSEHPKAQAMWAQVNQDKNKSKYQRMADKMAGG